MTRAMFVAFFTLMFVLGINFFLGWQGLLGSLLTFILCHVGYYCEHGYWFGDNHR